MTGRRPVMKTETSIGPDRTSEKLPEEIPDKKPGEAEEITLEEAFERLDRMIGKLQSQDISLDEAFSGYEEGMKLLKLCGSKIDLVEKKVLELNGEGEQFDFS